MSCHSNEFRLFLISNVYYYWNLMETTLYKSPSRQPFSYQHLRCSQEAITESMKTGNIEAFPPQDCVRTIGTDLEGLKPHICCFRWALGVFHPEGLPLIPPLQPCEISETCFLWMLLITHTAVTLLPLADMGTSVKLLHECPVWLRESQGGYEMTIRCHVTIPSHHL